MARMPKYKDLIEMSNGKIKELYDESRQYIESVPSFWLDELIRKEQRKYNKTIKNCTIAIVVMTAIIMISTIINIFY